MRRILNIDEMIDKVNLMPNNKERALKICMIYSYMNFLLDSHQIRPDSAEEKLKRIVDVETFLKHFVRDEKKYYGSLLSSIYILNPIYEDILNYANKYPLFKPYIPSVNIDKMVEYLRSFLNHIDPTLLALLDKFIDKQFIVEATLKDMGGRCHKFDGYNSGIVLQFNTNYFYKVVAIVHEMGHAYYHYLNKSMPTLSKSNIANESLPKILEYLFIEYLRINRLMDENSLNQYERFFMTHHLDIMNSVYIVNKLLIDGTIEISGDPAKMKVEMPLETYYNLSIVKIKSEDSKNYMKFDKNYYAFAFMLAMIMRENYVEDPKAAIEVIKELPQLALDTDAIEFIDLYDKTDYLNATKKNLSRVLSTTHYKGQKH